MKNPFHFPRTNRGLRRAELALVAAGVAIAILYAWLQLALHERHPKPRLDKIGMVILTTQAQDGQ